MNSAEMKGQPPFVKLSEEGLRDLLSTGWAIVGQLGMHNPQAQPWRSILQQFEAHLRALPSRANDRDGWVPVTERLPEVEIGDEVMVWICTQSKNGKRYVRESWWVNRPTDKEEYQEEGWVIYNEDSGDPMHCVGWHKIGCNSNYDQFFMPEDDAAEIIAWMPIPRPDAALSASEGGGR